MAWRLRPLLWEAESGGGWWCTDQLIACQTLCRCRAELSVVAVKVFGRSVAVSPSSAVTWERTQNPRRPSEPATRLLDEKACAYFLTGGEHRTSVPRRIKSLTSPSCFKKLTDSVFMESLLPFLLQLLLLWTTRCTAPPCGEAWYCIKSLDAENLCA